MTAAAQRPRTRSADHDRRDALRTLVQDALDALVSGDPAATGKPGHALALARATAEEGDGSGGRACAGIRTAWAYLASGQTEDAFFALECARDAPRHGMTQPAEPSLSFVGTATVLLRCAGMRVLTDPNFLHRGQRAYLGHGLTSRRLTEPAWGPEELAPVDAVVLSHLHGDHWDRETRRRLPRTTPIVTTRHASKRLQTRHGFPRAVGLGTWESHTVAGPDGATLRVTALPGRHAPRPLGRLLPPVMGSLLEFATSTGSERRVYLSGDTLAFDGLQAIREHIGEVDRAVLHLGGTTLPGGLVVTMDGRQGVEALRTIAPRRATPVHYDDYTVFRSPLSDFVAEAERHGWIDRVDLVARGDTIRL